MIKFILLGILLVFTVHQAFAQNVTMTTDSSEYYFLIGDDVAIGAMVNSSFPNTLTGNIEYTTVVTVRQPGMQTVNTNVGNSPVTINPGVEQLLIQFGSYQTETTLQTTLHVTYSDVEQYELVHDFTVHIVADDSQKNNQNDPSQSSSQQQQSQQQQQQSQQQQQQQQQQQGQQQGQNQQQGGQDSQGRDPLSKEMSSKLQNNQLPQDSEALREKFKDDVEQSQQAEQQFKEELLKDETFEKLNQELQEDGYELTDAVFNAESNDTGNFTLDYQNSQGEWANLQGSMNDGQLDELKKQTQASQEAMNENLRSSEAFQELNQQLLDEGFVETGTEFDSENLIPSEDSTGGGSESANQNQGTSNPAGNSEQGDASDNSDAESDNSGAESDNSDAGSGNPDAGSDNSGTESDNPDAGSENSQGAASNGENSTQSNALEENQRKDDPKTQMQVQYENPETNVTATITGSFDDEDELEQVVLERSDSLLDLLWWIVPLLGVAGFIAYLLYTKYRREIKSELERDVPFDYRGEARRLMALAQDDYNKKEYKDAFANGGRAVRMLVIYQLGLNQEATNKELLNHLDHKMPNFMKISGALGTCSLVEFAKAEPTGDNFENVVSVFESLYGKNPIKKRIS